jgi:hypothetical protein
MNTPIVIEGNQARDIGDCRAVCHPIGGFVLYDYDDGGTITMTKKDAIDLAKHILVQYQEPFCNRVSNDRD